MLAIINALSRYRHLAVELTKREFKDRYAQQALDGLWTWLHPLLLMALFTTIFSYIFSARFAYRENHGILPMGKTGFARDKICMDHVTRQRTAISER